MSISRTPEAPPSARDARACMRRAGKRRARRHPARLVWVLGLAVGIIGGTVVAYGLSAVTAGAAPLQAPMQAPMHAHA